MKKIFTLLFAVGFLMAANAQPGTRDNRIDQQNGQRDNQQYGQRDDQQNGDWNDNSGYSNGRDIGNNGRYDNDDRYHNSNGSYGRGMEMRMAWISRKYDYQIQQVRNDFFMRRYEKMRAIRSLEEQRQREIRMLYKTSGNRGRQHDRDYNSNGHY